MFGLSIDAYALYKICVNIDSFINVHVSFNSNITDNSIYLYDKKMKKMKNKKELLIKFLKENKLKPVYIYEDLHLEDTKNIIRKETSDLGGIYLIFNKITGDYYVGSASTNRFHSRLSNHLIYFKGSKIVKHAVR